VTLRAVAGHQKAETVDDLAQWLSGLSGCPQVSRTVTAECSNPTHDEPATWFYVEADRTAGVARLRCLSCGRAHALFDSEERWTYPAVWSCANCGQSIAETAYGLHVDDGDTVTWVAMGVRCVNCGDLAGVSDFVVTGPVDNVMSSLAGASS
jgi:ribosomal protein L37AE/L43A